MLTADTITDEQIQTLWHEEAIDTHTCDAAQSEVIAVPWWGGALMMNAQRHQAREKCAEILNARLPRHLGYPGANCDRCNQPQDGSVCRGER